MDHDRHQHRAHRAHPRRPDAAHQLGLGRCTPDLTAPAPQWRVIKGVTAGHALLAAEDTRSAENALRNALITADSDRLPHQIQRIVRIARDSNLHQLDNEAETALTGLRACLALPQQSTPS